MNHERRTEKMTLPINLLHCPACRKGSLSTHEDQNAHCDQCHATFAAGDGVIDLLPAATQKPGYAQRTMEWPWLVRLYESWWWRRSPLIAAALGCTFEQEQDYVLRSLALQPEARILALACGPGIYTRPIARAVPQGVALGLDISWPMLSYAAARAREESIEYQHPRPRRKQSEPRDETKPTLAQFGKSPNPYHRKLYRSLIRAAQRPTGRFKVPPQPPLRLSS